MGRQGWEPEAYDKESYDPTKYGGGHQITHYDAEGNPGVSTIADSADAELDRYRDKGADAAKREAYQLQFGAANANRVQNLQARDQMREANNLQGDAARGGAPSRAAIEGGQVASNSLEEALTASAGARQPGMMQARGQMSAEQAAQQQQRSTLLGADQATVGRGGEIARARTGYGQGATAMRQGDYALQGLDQQQAEAQGASEMAQRQRNAQAQQGYEKMGISVEQAEVDAGARKAHTLNKANEAGKDASDADQQRAKDVYQGTSGTLLKMAGSDKRMKQPASLTELRRKSASMRDQVDAENDSLKYGPSTSKAIDRASGGDGPDAGDDVDDSDVSAIRGKAPRTTDEQDDAALLREQRLQLARDDMQHDQRLQLARDDQQEDRDRPARDRIARNEQLDDLSYGSGAPKTGDRGVGGAPRGYSASRSGAGDMFGDHAKQWDTDHEVAPGTYDGLRYGEPTKKKPDAYSQSVSLSDEEAKKKASLAGKEAGAAVADSVPASNAASKATASVAEELSPAEHNAGVLRQNASKAAGYGDAKLAKDVVLGPWVSDATDIDLSKANRNLENLPQNLRDSVEARPAARTPAQPAPGVRRLTTTSGAGKESNVPLKKKSLSDESAKEHAGDTTGGSVQDPEIQRDANRKLHGETYRYKEGFGEETERVHHGFMAQNLEENPITATAVRDDDGTGVKKVDNVDALRVTAAGVAQLQDDQDEMQGALAKLLARRRRA